MFALSLLGLAQLAAWLGRTAFAHGAMARDELHLLYSVAEAALRRDRPLHRLRARDSRRCPRWVSVARWCSHDRC